MRKMRSTKIAHNVGQTPNMHFGDIHLDCSGNTGDLTIGNLNRPGTDNFRPRGKRDRTPVREKEIESPTKPASKRLRSEAVDQQRAEAYSYESIDDSEHISEEEQDEENNVDEDHVTEELAEDGQITNADR